VTNDTERTSALAYIAFITLMVHLVVNALALYGIFRDELYYIACSKHLDWGFVDQPPLSALILAVSRTLFGDALITLRLLPALAHACTVLLAGLMARELGGNRYAQVLAAVSTVIPGVYLSIFNFYSMNSFDILIWAFLFFIVIKIINADNQKLWLAFGLVAGLGLENKLSVMFLLGGLFVGLLLTQHRRHFLSGWLWLGVLITAFLFLPHILWQMKHDWPTLEFMRNATMYKNLQVSPFEFFLGQFMDMHPLTLLVWMPGLLYFLFSAEGGRYRLFSLAYIAIFIVFVMQNGKPYYQSPFYTVLFAGGGVVIGHLFSRRGLGWLKPVLLVVLVAGGALTAPLAMPVLPVESYIRYAKALGIEPRSEERDTPGKLPQHFADMFGWEEMAAAVGMVYRDLTPEEQARCAIFGQNYGQAGAIDYFGAAYGLPNAISGHNNYWLWGPGDRDIDMVIIIGGSQDDHLSVFEECEAAAVYRNDYARSFESDLTLYICRRLRMPIEELWPRVRHYE
jgi:hypothetical protein